jgi:2-polyprenyl-3-methyl-5-hydroxy-6-metoxy-1,4-benzoquinol methylase
MKKPESMEAYVQMYKDHEMDTMKIWQDPKQQHHYNALKKMIPSFTFKPVILDVGCNSGGFNWKLKQEMDGTFLGIDIKPWWENHIGKEHTQEDIDNKYFISTAEKARQHFHPNSMNVIVIAEVLEHVMDDYAVAKVMYELLAPGGVIVGSVPHHEGPRGRGMFHKKGDIHLREYDKDTLTKLLTRNGFRDVVIEPCIRADGQDFPFYHIFKAVK